MRKWVMGAGIAISLWGCLGISGCGRQNAGPAVLAERTEAVAGTEAGGAGALGEAGGAGETDKSGVSDGADGANSVDGADSENGKNKPGASDGADGADPNGRTGVSNGTESGETLREKTEAPARYQVEIRAGALGIKADAVPVEVPDAAEIPTMTLEKKPYSEEEYSHVKELFTKLWGMEWGEETIATSYDHPAEETGLGIHDRTGKYYLSFWAGEQPQTASIIWLNREHAYSNRAPVSFTAGENETKALKEFKEKSEEFLKLLGAEDMKLFETRWVNISENDTAQPGLCLWYRRTCEGIPILGSGYSVLGESPKSGTQYFRFIYSMDGNPVEVMGISREEYRRKGTEEEFLLPFAAVVQIFKQHCRVYQNDGDNQKFAAEEINRSYVVRTDKGEEALMPGDSPLSSSNIDMTRVALEYRYFGEDYGEGTLVPVWNFYGMMPVGLEDADSIIPSERDGMREVLLVSIGASDGAIY